MRSSLYWPKAAGFGHPVIPEAIYQYLAESNWAATSGYQGGGHVLGDGAAAERRRVVVSRRHPAAGGGRGRHSTRASVPLAKAALAALGAGLIIVTAWLVHVALDRPGAPPPGHGTAAATGPASPASQPKAASPAAVPVPPSHRDPLAAAATSYLATRTGTVLAAVYDIATGQMWSLGQGQPQAEASIVKVNILEALLAELHHHHTGLSEGDRSLARQMIEDSDNSAATSLWTAVGGADGIRSFNAAVGLAHTSPSLCVDCPGFPWPGWGLSTTTPADQIALLRELVKPNALLTSADRSYALRLMENVTDLQRWGVSGGVPPQATVALKNGWLPLDDSDNDWQINSVGWVSGSGRNYLMAVLTTGNPTEQYGIDTISQLAALVWKRMS
jgi:beta-lactamase class A